MRVSLIDLPTASAKLVKGRNPQTLDFFAFGVNRCLLSCAQWKSALEAKYGTIGTGAEAESDAQKLSKSSRKRAARLCLKDATGSSFIIQDVTRSAAAGCGSCDVAALLLEKLVNKTLVRGTLFRWSGQGFSLEVLDKHGNVEVVVQFFYPIGKVDIIKSLRKSFFG